MKSKTPKTDKEVCKWADVGEGYTFLDFAKFAGKLEKEVNSLKKKLKDLKAEKEFKEEYYMEFGYGNETVD